MKIHKLFLRSKNPPIGKEVLLKYGEGKMDCRYRGNSWAIGYSYKPNGEKGHGITCFVDRSSGNLVRSKKDFIAWCELPS